MFVLLLSFVSFILAAVLLLKKNKPQGLRGLPQAPGPLALPIIGSSYTMRSGESPFIRFTELADKYGDVYSMTLGSTKCMVISSVKVIRNVLMQNGKFFGGRPDFIRYHKLFAEDRQNSLALCDWCNLQTRRRNIARRHCDPKTHSPLNKIISDVGANEMREMVATLSEQSAVARKNNEEIKIKPVVMATCLNIFTQYMCSTRFDVKDPEFCSIVKKFDEIFWEINQGYAVDFFPWLLPFYKSHMQKLSGWSTEIRHFILSRIIDSREDNLDDEETEKDFTDALLKALKNEPTFTRESILFTLEDFLGGSSAVGNLLVLTLAYVLKNPEVAKKVQQEVDNLTQGLRPVQVSDSADLPYCMATIKETLRYGSSPIVPHVASEDTSVEGFGVEKGTVILINNYKINMDETLWDEPTKFDPERFLDRSYVEVKNERRGSEHDSGVESETESSHKSKKITSEEHNNNSVVTKKEVVTLKENLPHFMPFSIGKRTCLGRGLLSNYALVGLATILQNFDIGCKRPDLITTYKACVALPVDTFGVTLVPRKNAVYC